MLLLTPMQRTAKRSSETQEVKQYIRDSSVLEKIIVDFQKSSRVLIVLF